MSNREPTPGLEAEELAVARRDSVQYEPGKLQIAGIEVTNLAQALDAIKNLPDGEKAAAITTFNAELLQAKDKVEDVIVNWKDMVQSGEALGLEGDALKEYNTQNAAFIEAAKEVEKARAISQKALTGFIKMMGKKNSSRAQAFGQHVQQEYSRQGKNFYGYLNRLFKAEVEPREAIRLINMMTLRRNRAVLAYARSEFTRGDVKNALDHLKDLGKDQELEIEELQAPELSQLGFSFGESGVLIKGTYADEPFPAFVDEPADWKAVVINAPKDPDPEHEAAQEPMEGLAPSLDVGPGMDEVDFDQFMGDKPDSTEGLMEPRSLSSASTIDPPATSTSAAAQTDAPAGSTTRDATHGTKRTAPEHGIYSDFDSDDDEHIFFPSKKARTNSKKTTPKKKKPVLEAAEIGECSCRMSDSWKGDVALWGTLNFESQRSILEAISLRQHYGAGLHEMPCLEHFRLLAELLSLQFVEDADVMIERMARVYGITKDRTSFRLAWVHPDTRQFFLSTPEIASYVDQHLVKSRFRPEKQTVIPVPAQPSVDLPAEGVHVVDQHLAWIEKSGIQSMLIDEIEMLRFHLRHDAKRLNGVMPNGYFPLAVQLLWANPTVWLLFHRMLPDHPVFLVAHPQPIRYYDKDTINSQFYEGDTGKLEAVTSLCAEALLSGDNREIGYLVPKDSALFDAFAIRAFQDRKYVDLTSDCDEFRALEQFMNGKDDWIVSKVPRPYDMHVYRLGTTIIYPFPGKKRLSQSRISLPVSLILVGSDDICETGVPYEVIKASHDNRRVPTISRFRDTAGDESFVGSVQLEGVGALYDMIRCLKRPDHLVVRAKMRRWLEYKNTQANKMLYLTWKKEAAKQVRIAFEYLREDEMAMFPGNKSYFRCKMEGLELPVDDDKEYVEISSSDEDGG